MINPTSLHNVSAAGAMRAMAAAPDDPHVLWAFDPEERWPELEGVFGAQARVFPTADGKDLYVGFWDHVVVLDSSTGEVKRELDSEVSFSDWQAVDPARGRLFKADDDAVVALEAETGATLWSRSPGKGDTFGRAAPSLGPDGTVYAGGLQGTVYALDGETGKVKWKGSTGYGNRAAPEVGPDGRVYVATLGGDGPIIELDAATGARLREISVEGKISSELHYGRHGLLMFERYREGPRYDMAAVDPTTGKEAWHFDAPEGEGASFPPASGPDGHLWIATTGGGVYELDGPSGKVLEVVETGEDLRRPPVVAADGKVYVSNFDDEVMAVVPDTAAWISRHHDDKAEPAPEIVTRGATVSIGGVELPIHG